MAVLDTNDALCFFTQAFRKLDEIATQHTDKLRKLTKQVQEHRLNHDDEAVKRVVEEYDETLEWCVCVCVCVCVCARTCAWDTYHTTCCLHTHVL